MPRLTPSFNAGPDDEPQAQAPAAVPPRAESDAPAPVSPRATSRSSLSAPADGAAASTLPAMVAAARAPRATARRAVGSAMRRQAARTPVVGAALGRLSTARRATSFNPIMMLLNRLPLPRWIKGPAGCGCTAASCLGGCGGPMFIGCGCFPILGLFFAIAVLISLIGRQPDFAPALFCRSDIGERDRGAICESDSAKASLTLRLDDLPAAAYDEYRAADKAESLPWFLIGAWERVATNFGQRGGGAGADVDIPVEAAAARGETFSANISLIAEVIDGDRLEESPGSVDMTSLQSLFPGATESDPVVALRSSLRGGSFGLFLITSEEYVRFGSASSPGNERAIDAWDREDGAAIVARLLEARFNERQLRGENFYRFPAIGEAERLGTEIATYLSGLAARAAAGIKTEEALKDPENPVRLALLILNGDFCADERGVAVLRDCGFFETDVSDAEVADFRYPADAPNGLSRRGPTEGERRALCLAALPAEIAADRCARFEALPLVTEVNPELTFDTWLSSIYTPVGEVPDWTYWDWRTCGPPGVQGKPNSPVPLEDIPVSPGYDVCDWNALFNVFGDLIDDPGVWGGLEGDPTASYEVELLGPDGSRESFMANVYAEAMLRYGRSLFEADLEQAMAGIDYGADIAEVGAIGRLDLPALRVWNPGIVAVAPEMGALAAGDNNPVARAYLRALITTKLKGVTPVDIGSGCDYYKRERKPLLPLPGVETGNGSSPSNVVGCTLFGRGTVSYYASDVIVDGMFNPSTDAFVAMNHCSLGFRLQQTDASGAGSNCGSARIRVLDEDGAVIASGTFPVRDYCDCFVIASETYPIVSIGTTVKRPRIADLSGGALKAIGIDPSAGLYEVEIGLTPPENPIGWSELVLAGAEMGAGTLAAPTPAITWLVDTLVATPNFPGVTTAGIADWIVAAEAVCRAQSRTPDCIVDPKAPATEISDPLNPEAAPRTVVLSPFGRALLRTLERFGAGPAKSWPIAADGRFNQRWGCTGYVYEPPRGSCAHYHNGIDIGAPLNTKMLAVAPGTVTWAGPSSYNTVTARFPVQLWLVIVHQDDGYTTVYGHSGDGSSRGGCAPTVRKGDLVRAGQEVGCVGLTGHTTGPHIHFTMYRGSRLRDINPCDYLPAMPSGRPACRNTDGIDVPYP